MAVAIVSVPVQRTCASGTWVRRAIRRILHICAPATTRLQSHPPRGSTQSVLMQVVPTQTRCWITAKQALPRVRLVAPSAMPPSQENAGSRATAPGRPLVNRVTITFVTGSALLVANGGVPKHDLIFSLAWPAYLWAMNTWRFESNAALQDKPPGPLVAEDWVRTYAAGAGVLAILIPAALCLLNVSNTAVLMILGPHMYLTMVQVLCEYCTRGSHVAMLPRMLVPIGFNTYRMWTLWVWATAAISSGLGPWHVGLAVANLLFWAYNLFVFLLGKMVPIYLDPAKCAK